MDVARLVRSRASSVEDAARRVARPADAGSFGDDDLAGLPEPVIRYLRAAIAPGTPRSRSARITMTGHIDLGRWIPFRAEETLTPSSGFVWSGAAALVVRGSDRYVEGTGRLDWRLLGLVPVARADGPDVDRSSAGRCVGEAVWLPTSLLPRFGVRWTADDEHHVVATLALGGDDHRLRLSIDDAGRLRSVTFDRWGDPTSSGRFDWHPFGLDATDHATFAGMTIPSAGRAGWYHGTDRWSEGEFFRYRITALRPLGPEVAPDAPTSA